MKSLADQADRDRFKTELDRNFCVSASAGAGKTTAIVDRIVALAEREQAKILQGDANRLSSLVVVTYGVLAAEELRLRAREKILQLLADDPARSQRLLAELGRAFFGTIHGFCLKLLREEGRCLGLAPGIELLEDKDDRIWRRFLETDPAGPVQEEFLQPVLRHHTLEEIFALAWKIRSDEAERLVKQRPATAEPVLDFSEALAAESQGRGKISLEANKKQLRAWLEDFNKDGGYLAFPEFTTGGAAFLEAWSEAQRPYEAWVNERVLWLTAWLAVEYRNYRISQGWMSYEDMVVQARALLGHPNVLQRLRARESTVILDEAQDTDPNMFAILTELTRAPQAEVFNWPEHPEQDPPLPGRFCFVGDDQQMIYSKRADLDLYRRYVGAFRDGFGGELLDFTVTMRCPGAVVELVNGIFPGRLDKNPGQVNFKKLQARPGAETGWVRVLELEKAPSEKVAEQFADEARQVALWLKENGLATTGAARWSDVAVLCPRVEWLTVAAAQFKAAGLPVRVVSSKQCRAEQPAYSWPVALLHLVVHPTDRFEWIGVLREIFALSDAEIWRARQRQAGGLSLVNSKAEAGSMGRAAGWLCSWRDYWRLGLENGSFSLAGLCQRMLDDLALPERIEAIGFDARPLEQWRVSAAAADEQGLDLQGWLEALKRDLDKAPLELPSGRDEIQFMTAMKAKGLEWPVVVVLGLGRGISQAPLSYPELIRKDGRWVAHFSARTYAGEIKEQKNAGHSLELERLFYVLLTRAKKTLLIGGTQEGYYAKEKQQQPSFAALSRWTELGPVGSPRSPGFAGVEKESVAGPAEIEVDVSAARMAAASILQRVLPHELACEEETVPERVEKFATIEPGGVEYGTWWHEVLERFPWKESADRHRCFVAAEAALAPELFRARAKVELNLWLESPLYQEMIMGNNRFLVELPFMGPMDGRSIIDGVMDLVVLVEDGSCRIVDWKTNRLRQGETPAQHLRRLQEIYAGQLQAYADFFQKQAGLKVGGLHLYATTTGQALDLLAQPD